MAENNFNNYISLQKATDYCEYSQEYLSLRARQGKLKAVKIGRNWITKKEWIDDYIAKVEDYKEKNGFCKQAEKAKEILPPENLPIGEFDELKPAWLVQTQRRTAASRSRLLAMAAVILFFAASVFVFKSLVDSDYQKTVFETTFSYLSEAGKLKDIISEKKGIKMFAAAGSRGETQSFLKETKALLKDYSQWLVQTLFAFGRDLKTTAQKTFEKINLFAEFWEKPKSIVEKKVVQSETKEGMIVFPSSSSEKDKAMKEKIKASFSDEVKVKPLDKSSGVIIPVFKKGEGGRYMYVMVPVKK